MDAKLEAEVTAIRAKFELGNMEDRFREVVRMLHDVAGQLDASAQALVEWVEYEQLRARCDKYVDKGLIVPPLLWAELVVRRDKALRLTGLVSRGGKAPAKQGVRAAPLAS